MDKVQKLIQKLMSEGKSDAEIAQAVLELPEEDRKELNALEIAQKVASIKEQAEVMEALKQIEADKKAKEAEKQKSTELQKAIDDGVKAQLKACNIDPTMGKFRNGGSLKRFNHRTGKIEEVSEKVSEVYNDFNRMLLHAKSQEWKEVKAISNQIDIENDHLDPNVKATPTVSDVDGRGGYAIPTEVNDQIMQMLYEESVAYKMVNKDNVIMNSKVYPLMYGMSVGYISNESTELTETNPTLSNPSISMKRVGGYSTISNEIINKKGADLVSAFAAAYASAFAEFLDLHIPCGNVTGNSDLVDGMIFDANASLPTAIALSALTLDTLKTIKNTLSAKAKLKSTIFMANRTVSDAIGLLEDTGGNKLFPSYIQGGKIAPFGIPLVTNSQIPSTLDVGGDNRTSGSDDVLIAADMSKVIVGVSGETRIDSSSHFLFTTDLMAMRAVKNFGQKVITGSGTAGVAVVGQELTNA